MSLLPTRATYNQSAASVLAELKKGDKQKQTQFIVANQERLYAIAFLASGNAEKAENLTITAFQNAFSTIKQINIKQVGLPIWEWLAPFIVQACADYHQGNSGPARQIDTTDPAQDGSATMDWETTVILGVPRVVRCLNNLAAEQRKVFILRHQLFLDYGQIAAVINADLQTVISWLYRARVQIVKCLGRG